MCLVGCEKSSTRTTSSTESSGEAGEANPTELLEPEKLAALPATPGLRASVLDGNPLRSTTPYKFTLPAGRAVSYSISSGLKTVPVGDVTGDGIDDIAFTSNSTTTHKQSLIVPGRTGGWPDFQSPGIELELPAETLSLKYSFSNSIGDINSDGRDDFVVLAEQYQASDLRTYVMFDPLGIDGGTAGAINESTSMQLEHPGRIIHHAEGIGDSNGDGIDDFIVYSGFTRSTTDQPQAFLVLGRSDGFPSILNLTQQQRGVVPITIAADTTGYAEVRAIGDVNGDGLSDFLLAYSLDGVDYFDSPWFVYDFRFSINSFTNVIVLGRAWFGTSSLVVSDTSADNAGIFSMVSSRILSPLGDIDGDRLSDLFVGWGDSLTSLSILPGLSDSMEYASATAALRTISWSIPHSIADRFYGEVQFDIGSARSNRRATQVKGAGDLDGDGIGDVVVYQSTNGDYYHYPLGQYYILYGGSAEEHGGNLGPSNRGVMPAASTLVTDVNGPPIAVGDVDNDGVMDLGVSQAAYILEQNTDLLTLSRDSESGKESLIIPPYVDGYAGGHFKHSHSASVLAQIIPSPGMQEHIAPETWALDLNKADTTIEPQFLAQLLGMLEATEELEPETNNLLDWELTEFTRQADNSLATIALQQPSSGYGKKSSSIRIDENGHLFVEVRQGYYSAGSSWTHERSCAIEMSSGRVLDFHYSCRDALSVAMERLASWR